MSERPIHPWSRRAKQVLRPARPPIDPREPRPIFIGAQCYERKRAHWFIFLPVQDAETGRVVQVIGNVWHGFGFEIKDNYDFATNPAKRYLLGHIQPTLIVDSVASNHAPQVRSLACAEDIVERIAFNTGLPYRDPNAIPPDPDDPIWLLPHRQFERCQEWTRRVVGRLVESGALPEEALSQLNVVPSVGE